MKEQLITFETAKLAKITGFDSETYVMSAGHRKYNNEGDIEFGSIKAWDDDDYFEAPTQSLLQKWLREKKNRNVRVGSTSLTCHFPYVEKIYDDGAQMVNIIFKGNYKTYEDALEFGIQEALRTVS